MATQKIKILNSFNPTMTCQDAVTLEICHSLKEAIDVFSSLMRDFKIRMTLGDKISTADFSRV